MVDDGNSESSSAVVELAVVPFNDAPTISGEASTIANVNELYQFIPQINDADDDLLAINIENLPQWASFDEKTGAISGTPTLQDLGSYSDIRISVADHVEQVSILPFRITVLGDAPVVTNSPEHGSYKEAQMVTLTCHTTTDVACDIYYTLDGSTPTASSNRYTTQIQIEQDSVLRFYGISAGSPNGDVVMAIYQIDTLSPTVEIHAPVEDHTLDQFTVVSGVAADVALDLVELQITDGTLYLAQHEGTTTPEFTPKESWVLATLNAQDESWHYATDGIEWPGGSYSITARAVDFAGNQSRDSVIFHYKLPGTQAYTRLSMELSTPAMKLDGLLDVSGKLTRLPETAMSLAGRKITLNVIQPNGTTIQHQIETYDEQGHYQISTIDDFSQKGRYQIEATFTETSSLAASTSSSPLLVGVNAGYAVLVQGRIDSREGLESHNLTANRIYSHLLNRGLLPENIRYFNFDTNQSGVDALPTVEGIREAIEVWPREKMNGSPAPLTVVMVDHGDAETFFVDGENQVITPEILDRWFDTLERYLSEEAAAESRNIVLGSCYSGSFIPALSSPGRVVITSASADEVSYKGPKEWDEATNSPIRVGEFFLEELFKKLGKGKTVRKSFVDATRKTEIFTRRGGLSTNSSSRFLDQAVQHPLLDDNGDGEGSNELDQRGDGAVASQLYLGTAGGVTGDAEGTVTEVEFSGLTETLYLSSQKSSAQLWAQSEDDSQIASAWVEVRAPGKKLEPLSGTGQVTNELPRELAQLNGDRGRWEVNYDSFSESGQYEIYYFLRDAERGGVSPLKRSVVYKNRKGNLAPEPFALLGPSYGEKRNTVLRFDWENASDPEEDSISYNLIVAKDRYFRQIIWRAEELTSSSTAIDEAASLEDLSSYFWKVEAVDPYGAMATSRTTGYFYTDNTQGVPGIVQGALYDQDTFDRLAGATIQYPGINGLEQVVTELNGSYQLVAKASDQVVLEISVGGYDKRSVTINDVVSGEVIHHSYGLSAGPLAAEDIATEVDEDQLLDITLEHSGSGYAEPLNYTVIQPEHGTVSVVDAAAGLVQFQSAPHYSGKDRFTFAINDGIHDSNEAEVLITIHPVNDAPVLDGSGTLSYLELDQGGSENPGVSVIEILGDALTDPDGISLEGIAITSIGAGAGELQFTQDGGESWNNVAGVDTPHPFLLAADPDIRLRFAPESSFVGETVVTFHGWDRSVGISGEVVANAFSYSETGSLSEASAQMHIEVVAANQPPVANPVTTETYEDTSFEGAMSATDAGGDLLTYTIVGSPSRGKLRQLSSTEPGFIYTPSADFYGSDQFTYQVSDGRDVSNIATVLIEVTAVNDVPVAIGDDNLSTYINSPIALNLRGEDVEGDQLILSIVTHPVNGTLSRLDGGWIYQPNIDWSGLDLLTFEVNDGLATSKAVQAVVEVFPEPNIPPVAVTGLSFSTEEETPFTGKLQGLDQNGDALSFQLVANGQKGRVEVTNFGTGEFVYTPYLNSNGNDQFYFKVSDGEDHSALASVEVQITVVNDAPVISGAPPLIAKPGEEYRFQPQVDNVDGDSLSFSIEHPPVWASFDIGTGVLSGTPTVDDSGITRAVMITVSDGELSDSLSPFDLLTLADTSKPWTTSSLSEGAYKTVQQVLLHCFDSAGGSCSIYYTTDGTTPTQSSSLYSTSIVINEDTQLSYFAVDGEDNAEEIRTVNYQIDASVPTVEITSPADGLSVDQIYWVSGSTADIGSGVVKVELQLTDGINYLTKNGLRSQASWVEATLDEGGGWIYNTTGIPWESGSQYSVTARAIDQAGNQTSTATLFGYSNNNLVQAFSDLTLEVPSQSILQDEKLRVTGKLTRLPETRMSLAGREIHLSVTNGRGLETARYTTETYDSHGHYTFEQVSGFPSKDEYSISVTFDETNLLAGSVSRIDLQVNSSAGYVVLVEGQTATGSVDEISNRTTNRIYQTLLARGFHAEDIYLLSPQNGQTEVDDAISAAALQSTLQSWVPQNLNAAPAPLYIILLPAGEQGNLLLDSSGSVLTVETLISDLNAMEKALNRTARAEKRIVLVGGDNGGSWIPTLSASGRIIIASSSAGERAYLGPLEPRGDDAEVEGRDLFIEELMMEWGSGRALKQAFMTATEKVEQLTRIDQRGDRINRFFDNALQHPLLDDNGYGVASNCLVKQGDGANSGDLYLGVGQGTLALTVPTGVTATQFLGEEQQSARIYVEADRDNPELPTWLALRSPSHTLKVGNNLLGFETLPFYEKDDQGRWMLNLDQLDERGQYELFYYQGDLSSELRSPSARSLLYRNRRGNSPPGAFHLQTPADQAEQQSVLVLDWGDATDSEADPISYTLTIAEDADFRTVVYRQEEIVASTTHVGEEAGLEDLTHYYWKIEAVDQYGAVRQSSEVWGFTTDNTNGVPGIVQGIVFSNSDFSRIGGATLSLGGTTISTEIDGSFLASLLPGTYTPTVGDGTSTINMSIGSIQIAANETVSFNISIEVDRLVAYHSSRSVNEDQSVKGIFDADLPYGFVGDFVIDQQPVKGKVTILDARVGSYRYQPNKNVAGEDSFTFIASADDGKVSNSAAVSIHIGPVNDAPTISGSPNTETRQGEHYSFIPMTIDPDPSDTLTISVENLPKWATLNPDSGAISGIPSNSDVGSYPGITLSVSDGIETIQLPVFSIEVSNINDAPTISGTPTIEISQGKYYSFTPQANDPDPSDTLQFRAENLPLWTSLDPQSGEISGTPENSDIGHHSDIRLFVSDAVEEVALKTFSIEVISIQLSAANNAPQISGTPVNTVEAGQSYTFTITATDVDEDSLTFNEQSLPGWLSFNILPSSATLLGRPTEDDVKTYENILISVTDGEATDTLGPFTIEVTSATAMLPITTSLTQGWNMMHFITQSTPTEIKQQVPEIEAIWGFLNCDKKWEYAIFQPDSTTPIATEGLTVLTPGQGYWIKLQDSVDHAEVTLSGTAVTTPITLKTASLYPGWNSVGVTENVVISQTAIPDEISSIWGWEGYWVSYVDGVPTFLNSLQSLDQNQGYFIYSDQFFSGTASCSGQ